MSDQNLLFKRCTQILEPGDDVGAWLQERAKHDPEACAYLYLRDGERDEAVYSYARLDREARAVAAWLLERGQAGDRVLLAHAPGPAFLPAFFGCLYAGMIAVPAYPPRRTTHLDRIEALLSDCGAQLAICDSVGAEALRAMAASSPRWAALRRLEADPALLSPTPGWEPSPRSSSDLAFLQYTSGSTRSPRGVMVSHGNLRHNASLMQEAFGFDAQSVSVSWLPVFHDMGLILGVLQPLYAGIPGVLMPPNAFLQKPLRWLEALSRYGGTHSPAPNFAYELCATKVSAEERASLDLSAWRCAVNGAEPVRRRSLRRFSQSFRAQGFRAKALCPAYGLAEGTLFVSGGPAIQGPRLLPPPQGLQAGEGAAQAWTGCGQVLGQDLRVVDPETRQEVAPGQAGEIWLKGASVAQGYWQQPQETAEVFGARLADGSGPYLRTGDLGYVMQGQVVLCGRLKDLIILRGSNHFPQDLEASVQALSPDFRAGCGAAFSVEQDGEEALVIVQELQRHPQQSLERLAQGIRQALAQGHGVSPVAIALVAPASVPKTSSGKIRRRACRQAFLDGSLQPQFLWQAGPEAAAPAATDENTWALAELTRLAQGSAPAAGLQAPFAAWALDSLQVTSFKAALETRREGSLSFEALYAAPSVAALLGGNVSQPAASRTALRPLAASFLVAAQAGGEASRVLVQVEGSLLADRSQVARALEALRQDHGSLRARYVLEDGQAWAIDDASTAALPLDLSVLPGQEDWQQACETLSQHTFKPELGALFRALWQAGAEGEGRLALLFDHLACDGWSVKIALQSLHAHLQGRRPEAESALGLGEGLGGSQAAADLEAWVQRMAGWDAFPSLPPGFAEAGSPALFASHVSRLSPDLVQALRARAGAWGVAPLALISAALGKLWQFWLPSERLVFNLAQHARGPQDLGLGCFADILPLDLPLPSAASLEAYARNAHQALLFAQSHASASGIDLARARAAAQGGRPQALSPITLTSALFFDWQALPGLRTERVRSFAPETWLDLMLFKDGEAWALEWNHRRDHISVERAARLERQFVLILGAIAAGRDLNAAELMDAEDHAAHTALNAGYEPITVSGTLSQRFEAQAALHPEAVALREGGRSSTYAALQAQADDLAARLQTLGAGPGKVVGIHLPRGEAVVVAILGVLKSGAAYLPMDPLYPRERLAFMVEDAELLALVAEESLEPAFAPGVPRVSPRAAGPLAQPHPVQAQASDLAYIIYTSGSTGRPKGCMISQGDVLRLFKATERHYDFNSSDRWCLFHSYAFDFSVWEIWGALLYGGSLLLVPEEEARSPRDFHAQLRREGVTVLNQTPSAFSALAAVDAALPAAERLQALRWVIFGGEALDYPSLQRWFEQHGDEQPRLVNMYGITETTVHVSFRRVRQSDVLRGVGSLIGVPLADMRLRLLDAQGQPTPLGVAGELWVGGGGVARGYWQRDELTAQRFVQREDGRYYRSGDLARLLPGQGLEYLGRGDQQIQLRGFRVELGEIQARLLEDPSVAEAAVLALGSGQQDLRLAAYLVAVPGQTIDREALRQRLAQSLPPYMLPAMAVLERLPLSAHGKLDRTVLPDPWAQAPAKRVLPADALEEGLLQAWMKLLRRPDAGVEDDFFASGGHSLMAADFHSQALRLSGASLPLKEFLAAPNVRALARALRQAPKAAQQALMEAPRRQRASAAQAALWTAQELNPGSAAYHIAWSWQGQEVLDPERVQRALLRLAQCQPALRSAFEQDAQGQLWHLEQGFDAGSLLWDHAQTQSAEQAGQWLEAWSRQPFALERAPLWRVAYAPLKEGGWILGFCVNHLIFDQRSFELWPTLLQEAELGVSEAPYWQALQALPVSSEVPAAMLELPGLADQSTAQSASLAPEVLSGQVPAATVERLKRLAQEEGASLFSVLSAAWAAALCSQHGGERAAFRVPVSLREGTLSKELLGYWVEPRGLALNAAANASWRERLRSSAQATRALGLGQGPAVAALPDLYLAYQGSVQLGTQLWGQRVQLRRFASAEAKALAALIIEGTETLELSLEFDPRRLSKARAQALRQAFVEALRQMALDPEQAWAPPLQLSQVQGPRPEPSEHRTIVEHLHAQVALDSEALALLWRGGQLNYGQLLTRVRSLAGYLLQQGLQPGQRVGLHCAPGPQWVVGLLACWEAGLVYVPLDPSYPSGRLKQMLSDARCQVLLSDRGPVHWAGLPCLDLEKAWEHPGSFLRSPGSPKADDAAYVVFTSGSTGRPKAVQVSHRALKNLARSMGRALGLQAGDRLLQFVSISFDPSLEELCSCLASGAALALPCRSGAPSAEELAQSAEDFGATVLHLPTAYWHACMAAGAGPRLAGLPALRALVVGGEAPDPRWLRTWLGAARPGHRFFNAYGPSEACVTSTLWSCTAGQALPEPIPLGHPLPGVRIALVDAEGQRVRFGQEGELWISGEGLADGYDEQGQLSQRGFEAAAWERGTAFEGQRWYHSGDRARMDADGLLSFVGRRDRQVKIAGHRLELGELEALLRQAPGVAQVASSASKAEGMEPRLSVWVTPLPGADLQSERLRAWLEQRLPLPLMPRDLAVVESLELTANGKVASQASLSPPLEGSGTKPQEVPAALGPRQEELAQQLCRLWQRLLGEPGAGLDADFFALGGSSLRAVRAAAEASTWSPRAVKVADIEAAPSPRALALRLLPASGQPERSVSRAAAGLLERRLAWRPEGATLRRLGGSDTGIPLLWLPPAGAGAGVFKGLVRAMEDLGPHWGLELPAPDGPQAWSEWVRRACERIEEALPNGPLVLGGWSVGALMAADLSQALQARGRQLTRLVLIDALQPDALSRALVAAQPAELGLWQAEGLSDSPEFQRAVRAAQQFRPQPLGLPVSLIVSEESARRDPQASWMAWALLAGEGLTSLLLPGAHHSVLHGQATQAVAGRLRRDLGHAARMNLEPQPKEATR